MQHWIIAAVAPLVELNPVKYIFDPLYRGNAHFKLGRRAKRIFVYQSAVVTLAVAGAFLLWLSS